MPTAADAGADATDRYRQLKLQKYSRYEAELRDQGIAYAPLIWTAWGRQHPDVTATMKALAARAARRKGLIARGDILAASRLDVSLALQARAARMVMRCHRAADDGGADDDGG